jgi:hypothetical protein
MLSGKCAKHSCLKKCWQIPVNAVLIWMHQYTFTVSEAVRCNNLCWQQVGATINGKMSSTPTRHRVPQ